MVHATGQVRIRSHRVFDGYSFDAADVVVADDRIVAVERHGHLRTLPHLESGIDVGDDIVAPGLVDVHNHGGGGCSFVDGPVTAIDTHRRAGTTTLIASLVTTSLKALEAQIQQLMPLVEAQELAGIHLEGPWLADRFKGAHPADRLRDPALEDVKRLVRAGNGAVKMVTLAAERSGALEAIAWLVGEGVISALGHSDCTYEQAQAAIEAGVTGGTHVFNAMPGLHHREPGPALALLRNDAVWCEFIVDGVHLHREVARWAMEQSPRAVLITDAMAAAGCRDGDYMLGELAVSVTDGVARLQVGGNIAGSTLVLADAVRNAHCAGVDLETVLRAATSNPAQYLHLANVGVIAAGAYADLIILDNDLAVRSVMRRGEWLE